MCIEIFWKHTKKMSTIASETETMWSNVGGRLLFTGYPTITKYPLTLSECLTICTCYFFN